MNILVKFEHYMSFVKQNKSSYLDKNNGFMIWTNSKSFVLNGFKEMNEEIFNGTETEYTISKNNDNYLIFFKTSSDIEYKLELMKETNIMIYHIAFSLSDRGIENYEERTNLNESLEVYSRLYWILKDINLDVDEYCIGATGDDKKDSIYKYMMRFVKSWEKRDTNAYKFGWALYFKLK